METAFRYRRAVQFHETDMAGVVHFTHLFRFMEEAEHAFLRSLGVPVQRQEEGRLVGFPRLSAHCDYRAPLRFGDEVEVLVTVREKRSRGLGYTCVVRRVSDGVEAARGQLAVVYAAIGAGGAMQPLPLPEALAQLEITPEGAPVP